MTLSEQQWQQIELVGQAIIDQARRQDLNMVKDRHTYLGTLLTQMEPSPRDDNLSEASDLSPVRHLPNGPQTGETMTSPETKAVRALLVLFDHVPDDFRHNRQTLRQRVEAWVAHAVEQVEGEVEGSDTQPEAIH